MSRRALVWIGSPKGLQGSNSARYGRALTRGMEGAGWPIEWVHLHRAVEDREGVENLVRKTAESDLILFIAPLYVDGLPSIRAFEELSEARSRHPRGDRTPSFAALIHRGFVEPARNATAINICRQLVAAAGSNGTEPWPSAAEGCRAEGRAMLRSLYILGGNAMWRRVSKKRFGVSKGGLRARPFAD